MIRTVKPEDWTEVSLLCKKELPSFSMRKEELNQKPFNHSLLLEENNQIKGVLFYQILYERAELDDIAVRREDQKLGIGSKLMEEFLKDCRKHEVQELSLEVYENNQSAIAFYQKFGFEEVAKRPHYYKEGDAILMVKKVKQ